VHHAPFGLSIFRSQTEADDVPLSPGPALVHIDDNVDN